MPPTVHRFEVSWDVCRRAGALHDDLVTRAAKAAEEFGDGYVLVGPWKLRDPETADAFEEEKGFASYTSSCRALGVPVRVGRWKVFGRPRAILVDGSGLVASRDALLTRLWESHRVDSFKADDAYAEPVMFGLAAGLAIDRYVEEFVRPRHDVAVAIANDWTSAAALLDAAARAPDVGTIYVVHETVVGSALSKDARDPLAVLATKGPEGVAADQGLRTRHSLEAACVRAADAVVAVGEQVERELRTLHGRTPTLVRGSLADADSLEVAMVKARKKAADRALGAYVVQHASLPGQDARLVGLSPKARHLVFDLRRLAGNLACTWDEGAGLVFAELDPLAWSAGRHDPLGLLIDAPNEMLESLALDKAHRARLAAAIDRLDAAVEGTPGDAAAPVALPNPVAYFCAEFGIHASLPVYSGGLGILAGDHVKAASDLGLAFVGVGLFYRRGYVRQSINEAGDQVPLAVDNDPRRMPMELLKDAAGHPVTVSVELPGTTIVLAAWRVRVGRVSVLLLDADVPENRPEDRAATARLYGGDTETRLRQEILLGIGGVRLLDRIGIEPAVIHMNEGHAAFAPLERASLLVHRERLPFADALARVRAGTIFTTHTPVPAGHDRFELRLLRRYFADVDTWLGTTYETFLDLGRTAGDRDSFNMTWLGLRGSSIHNGVSRLHGRVSRVLLAPAFPGVAQDAIPVTSVTNGVHLPTWTAPEITQLLGAEGRPVLGADFAARARTLDATALWQARGVLRRRLLDRVRADVTRGAARRREAADRTSRVLGGLDERALLVGFARRFATYKRADLLLRDAKRLGELASKADRPIRFLYAGKAHPNDQAGLALVRKIVEATRTDALLGKVIFLEDYDAALARFLVQGVDVWLNTPLRLLEASGTSGMKAAANGALNLSVRDGWWDEAFDGKNGFAIGLGPDAAGDDEDGKDQEALAKTLENEVSPLFFDRDVAGVPARWLDRVKESLATIPPVFDAVRMVREYDALAYRPLAAASEGLRATRTA